jgi:branched-chain amino acid transport system ATP-binding protein
MERISLILKNEIFKADNITVEFGGLTALKKVSVVIKEGEIRGIIGPNGAGKTTFFNAITNFVKISSGNVFFKGENISLLEPHSIAQKGVIRTFQKRGTIGSLTALENVLTGYHRMLEGTSLFDICFRTDKFKRTEREGILKSEKALADVGLINILEQTAGELSFGQQTLIEIARVLVSMPKLLLLDEPAAGLSSSERENLIKILRSLPTKHNVTLIITDHIMDFLLELCDNLTVLNFGEVLEEGNVEYIKNHPGVLEAYFGKG